MTAKSNDLGFGAKPKVDISGFKPTPLVEQPDLERENRAERAAEKVGFVSREPVTRVERVRRQSEPQDSAYVRGPVSMINRFKQYCNDTGLSYGEALDELMKRAGI